MLVAIGSLALTALATAPGCGGDDSSTTTVGDDGSTDSGSTTQQDAPSTVGAIEVIASDAQVYVGAQAHLDASQSKRPAGAVLTFAWTVKSAPNGSQVTTASLTGADSETPKFTTDVAGDYVLTATASVGQESASKDVTVHALNASVFFVEVNGKDVPTTSTISTVLADGTGQHALNCKQQLLPDSLNGLFLDGGANVVDAATQDGGIASQFGVFFEQAMLNAVIGPFTDVALDSIEMPAGTPSRAAFADIQTSGDGGLKAISLVVADTNNTCQSPPTRVHQIGQITGKDAMVLQPHFSPDGNRVVYLENRGTSDAGSDDTHVNVVGFDGSNFRELGLYCPATGSGNCWGRHLFPRRPQWLDPTHVGWIRVLDRANTSPPFAWEIVVASDSPGGGVSRYMTCSSYEVPFSFTFINDGTVLANLKPTQNAPEDLVVLGRDASGACTLVRNLTKLPIANKGSFARDFAVSPDGSLVAYMHHIEPISDASTGDPYANCPETGPCITGGIVATGGGKLYAVHTDGSDVPHPVGGTELDMLFGPRFISAGTRLAWNGSAPLPAGLDASAFPTDAGVDANAYLGNFSLGSNAINVVPVAGGPVVHAAIADENAGTFPMGGGNGGACECRPDCVGRCNPSCDVAGRGGAELGVGVGGLIGLVFVGRRRSRRRK